MLEKQGVKNSGTRLECIGDAEGGRLGFGGPGAGEMGIDRSGKEGDPTFEMFLAKREDGMLGPGAPAIIASAEEHGAPEGIHRGQVMVPIDFGNFVENRAEDLIAGHMVVE